MNKQLFFFDQKMYNLLFKNLREIVKNLRNGLKIILKENVSLRFQIFRKRTKRH